MHGHFATLGSNATTDAAQHPDFRAPCLARILRNRAPTMRSLLLRIVTLASVVANLALDWLVSLERPRARYFNLFTSSDFASIWTAIHLVFLGYCIFQLLPRERRTAFYDGLCVPLLVANVLSAGWLAAYREQLIVPSAVILCATLTCATLLYIPVEIETRHARVPWLRVPFSLLLGWLAFAALANLIALVGEPLWALTLMVLGSIVLVGLGIRCQDPVLPAVLAWAAFTIASQDPSAARVCVGTGVVAVVTSVGVLCWRLVRTRRSLPERRHRASMLEIPSNLIVR